MKKQFKIDYVEEIYTTLIVEAESEEQAREIAEDAWCNFDECEWKETLRTVARIEAEEITT